MPCSRGIANVSMRNIADEEPPGVALSSYLFTIKIRKKLFTEVSTDDMPVMRENRKQLEFAADARESLVPCAIFQGSDRV
jgi:hypothetical protein